MVMGTKKPKICINGLIASVIFILMSANASSQNVWVREHDLARNLITKEALSRDIGFLADTMCQGRAVGTRGHEEAAFWIQRQFEDAGLLRLGDTYATRVYIDKGLVGHNIVGMIPGSKKLPHDKYIIIGAHYDHLGTLDGKTYPGADSNASGVVAMINIARMISVMKEEGRSYDCNIIFVAFDAKEHSMAGSEALWKLIGNGSLKDPLSDRRITPDKIVFMANIDQIGTTLSPIRENRKDFMIMLGNESLPPIKREMIHYCNRFYGVNMDIALDYYGSENFTKVFYRLSDQRIFIDNGIPAVFFTSGITMNTNKTYDSLSSLDLGILRKRIFLIYHWIDRMI